MSEAPESGKKVPKKANFRGWRRLDLGPLRKALRFDAKGAPERPLFEAALVFAAFWLAAYLPADPSAAGAALASPAFHVALLAQLIPKALLLLYLMSRAEGLAAFGMRGLGWSRIELVNALLVTGGALAIALLPGLAAQLLGLPMRNPLFEGMMFPAASPFILIPLAALSSLAIGLGEELFFRVYLIRRIELGGLKPVWAATASSLLFASAHGIQGILGLVVAAALGGFFSYIWLKKKSFWTVALGHAAYDFVVILLSLYA